MLEKSWLKTKLIYNASFTWFLLVAVVFLAVGIWQTVEWWSWLHPEPPLEGAGNVQSQPTVSNSETLRNVGLLLGGLIAFILAIWRGWGWVAERQSATAQQQADTAHQGLLYDRYQRGAQMLGDVNLAVRLAGIYALQRLAEENPLQYDDQIVKLFCSFVRNHTESDEEFRERFKRVTRTDKATPEDVQTALAAIRDRCQIEENQKRPIPFRLDLGGASIVGCDLTGMDLSHAILDQARLNSCRLSRSNFFEAELSQTNFSGSDISECVFNGAKTFQTVFIFVSGNKPDFSDTTLMGTNFSDAKLSSPIFRKAMFMECEFKNASLQDADLSWAYFHTKESELTVFSRKVGLTQAQLDEGRWDSWRPPDLNGLLDAETLHPLVLKRQVSGEQ